MGLLSWLASGPFGVVGVTVFLLLGYPSTVRATPSIALPIAAQYPPTAQVGRKYRFQFAQTTFASADGAPLSFKTRNAPSWIKLDSPSRVLSGTPSSEDLGSVNFGLIATDNTGSIEVDVALLVTKSSAITAAQDIGVQLMRYGTLSGPQTLSFVTGESFNIPFAANTFTGPLGIEYFATSADNTPLPAWVQFGSKTRSFSGVAPPLIPSPQVFGIRLIASLVPGFSEASITFFLVINDHKLGFRPFERSIMARRGEMLSYTLLMEDLFLDGYHARREEISNAVAHKPVWLQFSNTTLDLGGVPPPNTISQDVLVRVTDIYEDTADAVIHIHVPANAFNKRIGQIIAIIGKEFSYTINQDVFSTHDLSFSIDFGSAASWLHLNTSTLTIYGVVPGDSKPQLIHATITAKTPSATDTQTFTIRLVKRKMLTSSRTSSKSSQVVSASKTHSPGPRTKSSAKAKKSRSTGVNNDTKLGIGLGCTFGFLIVVGLIMLWRRLRNHRSKRSYLCNDLTHKRNPYHEDQTEGKPNEFSDGVMPPATQSPAPQLDVQISKPDMNPIRDSIKTMDGKSKSAIGNGESSDAPHASDLNLTESLHLSSHTPDQPAEGVRTSKSGTHRSSASSRRRSGLPHQRVLTGIGHGRASNNSMTRMAALNAFVGSRDSGSWYTSSSESEHSMSQIDSFPHTPGTSRNAILESVPENPRRQTIKKVASSNETPPGDAVDDRPLDEKRQSYVRRRASTSRENVIFGSRVGKTPPSESSSRRSRLAKRSRLYRSCSSSVGVGENLPSTSGPGQDQKEGVSGGQNERNEVAAPSNSSQADVRDGNDEGSKRQLTLREMLEEDSEPHKGKWTRWSSRTNLRWARGEALPPDNEHLEMLAEEKRGWTQLGADSVDKIDSDGLESLNTRAGVVETTGDRETRRLLSTGTLTSEESSAALSSRFI